MTTSSTPGSAHRTRTGRRRRLIGGRAAAVLSVMSLIASVLAALLFPTSAGGEPPAAGTYGGFVIDGVIDTTATWYPDPHLSASELGAVNAATTKLGVIHTSATGTLDFTNPNAQTDLAGVRMKTSVDAAGDIWLYFAWQRDSDSGSGQVMFEFQKNAAPSECNYDLSGVDQVEPISSAEQALIEACNPWKNRAAGDFIISFDYSGSTAVVGLRTFVAGAGGTLSLGPIVDLTAAVAMASYGPDNSTGEAAINLSDTVFPATTTSCLTIANIIPSTVTGNSDTADFKDTILNAFKDQYISNCGKVNVTKVTDPTGLSGSFPVALTQDDGGLINYATPTPATTMSVTLTGDGDSDSFSDVRAATDYKLTETVPNGWDLVSTVCDGAAVTTTFSVVAGKETNCTLTNFKRMPALSLSKSALPTTYSAVGASIVYSYTITNSGNVTLSGPFSVTDDKATVTCTQPADGKLSPAETMGCSASHVITQADLDAGFVTNKATATNGTVTSNEATATVTAVKSPALTIVKTATPSTYDAVGDVIGYSYLVTNSGNVTLKNITVTDDKATVTCPDTSAGLAPTKSITCTGSYKIVQSDLGTGAVTNTAYAKSGDTQSPPDSETVTAVQKPVLTPGLSIVKTATPAKYSAVGTQISYSYQVTNVGNVTLGGPFTVSDNKAATSCPATASLSPGASITCSAVYTITQADLDAGSVTNIATASGGGVTSAPDSATVTADQDPKFTLAKGADPASGSIVQPGTLLTYTITYLNTGNVTLQDKVITDALPVGTVYESIADDGVFDTAANVASWHTGVVAPAGSKVVHWTVKVAGGLPAGSEIVNVGKIGDVTSNETRNPVASGALTLVKEAGAATVAIGDSLTYTLAVTATGTLDQTDVVVTDVVPEGTAYVGGSARPAGISSYDASSNTVTWLVGDMKAGTTVGGLTFTVTALGPPADPDGSIPAGLITNVGMVESAQTPLTPSNTVETPTLGFTGGGGEAQPVVRPPAPVLPFTGGAVPLQAALLVGLALVGVGTLLVAVRRREDGR